MTLEMTPLNKPGHYKVTGTVPALAIAYKRTVEPALASGTAAHYKSQPYGNERLHMIEVLGSTFRLTYKTIGGADHEHHVRVLTLAISDTGATVDDEWTVATPPKHRDGLTTYSPGVRLEHASSGDRAPSNEARWYVQGVSNVGAGDPKARTSGSVVAPVARVEPKPAPEPKSRYKSPYAPDFMSRVFDTVLEDGPGTPLVDGSPVSATERSSSIDARRIHYIYKFASGDPITTHAAMLSDDPYKVELGKLASQIAAMVR